MHGETLATLFIWIFWGAENPYDYLFEKYGQSRHAAHARQPLRIEDTKHLDLKQIYTKASIIDGLAQHGIYHLLDYPLRMYMRKEGVYLQYSQNM